MPERCGCDCGRYGHATMSNRVKASSSRSKSSAAGAASARAASSRRPIIIVVLAVVALVVAVSLLAARDADRDDSSSSAQVADVSIQGAALPIFEGAQPDPALRTAAPAFAATSFAGAELSMQPGDGTAKVIGFFAHWCPHCQRELPRLADWLNNNPLPDGVEVLAVSTSADAGRGNHPPSEWFESVQWPAAVVRDSATNEIAAAYGLRGFPYTVAVDAAGSVVARISGELDDERWESLLQLVAP